MSNESFTSIRQRAQSEHIPRSIKPRARNLFARSRTLTRSISAYAQVDSASQSRLLSPRAHEHHLRSRRRWLALGVFVAFSGALVAMWLLDQFILHPIVELPTGTRVGASSYTSTINGYFLSHPLARFRFATDKPDLRAYMQQHHSEIADVDLSDADGLVRAKIRLEMRQPVAKWSLGDRTYYVDGSGVAFEMNPRADPSVTVRDESGLPLQSQQLVASTKMMRFIGTTVDLMNQEGLGKVRELVIPPATLKEVDMYIDGRNYRIKMSTERGVVGQISDITHAITYLDGISTDPQYIDVRVEGRAFYR